jgi:SNF2 family DNA or RNA helicase
MIDMGLGKTVIALTAVYVLKYHWFKVRKALVIAPKKVARSTWSQEVAKWDHLRLLRVSIVLGTVQQRLRALAVTADVYVINRENVKWLVEFYRNSWPFDMVVVDELSSFKDSQSKRFKALRSVLPHIRRIIGLTGTPAPNGLEDLWAQMYLLDGGERLGKTLTGYRERYFTHNPYRHEFKAKAGADDAVHAAIRDICVSMSAKDYLELPECVTVDVRVELDAPAAKAYKTLEREAILAVLDGEITAATAVALSNKLLQLCNGAVYDTDRYAAEVHKCKLDVLCECVEGLNGEHALVFYNFRHDIPRIKTALHMVKPGLRVRELKTPEDEGAWNRAEVDVLLAHPASCAYGLNLQDGGHHVIWFGLNWSLELYQQANARLFRQGQKSTVIIHRLIVTGGLDEDVVAALEGKRDTQDALLNAIRAKVEKIRQ